QFISDRPAPGLYSDGPYRGAGLFPGAGTGVEDEPVGGRHVLVVSEVKQVVNGRGAVRGGQEGKDERSRPAACWPGPWAWPVGGRTGARSRDSSQAFPRPAPPHRTCESPRDLACRGGDLPLAGQRPGLAVEDPLRPGAAEGEGDGHAAAASRVPHTLDDGHPGD